MFFYIMDNSNNFLFKSTNYCFDLIIRVIFNSILSSIEISLQVLMNIILNEELTIGQAIFIPPINIRFLAWTCSSKKIYMTERRKREFHRISNYFQYLRKHNHLVLLLLSVKLNKICPCDADIIWTINKSG